MILWPDTFNNYFFPQTLAAAAEDETELEQLDGSPEDHMDRLRPPGLVRRGTAASAAAVGAVLVGAGSLFWFLM